MISANIDSSLSTWIGFAICPFIPASLFRTAFPYFLANHLALYNYSLFTNNARIAFNTARIITPTSAKIASHILAIPTAPRIRQISFTPMATYHEIQNMVDEKMKSITLQDIIDRYYLKIREVKNL